MLKEYKWLIISVIVFFSLINAVQAAPAMYGLAINNDTHECAGYWAGDEFVYFDLPENWTSYYPTRFYNLSTPYGNCYFEYGTNYSECCKQLELTIIDPNTILYSKDTFPEGLCQPSMQERLYEYRGLSINSNTKECTSELQYLLVKELGDGEQSVTLSDSRRCLLDKDWEAYEPVLADSVTVTPYGSCDVRMNSEECCKSLHLKFVSENIGDKNQYIENNELYISSINISAAVIVALIIGVTLIFVFLMIRKRKRR